MSIFCAYAMYIYTYVCISANVYGGSGGGSHGGGGAPGGARPGGDGGWGEYIKA